MFNSISNQVKGILILVAIILGFVVILLGLIKLRRYQTINLEATALLKKIEYVQELKLVTYYYEELLAIGTEERVAKIAAKNRIAVKEAQDELITKEFKLALAESRLDSIDRKAAQIEDKELLVLFSKLEKTRTLVNEIKKFSNLSRKKQMEALEGLPGRYGASIEKAFFAYVDFMKKYDVAKRREKKLMDPERKSLRSILEKNIDHEKRVRMNTRDMFLDQYNRRKERGKKERQITEKAKIEAEKHLKRVQKDYDKAVRVLDENKRNLALAEEELRKAKEAGTDIEPKLLIIVPVEVTGYMDMEKIQTSPSNTSEDTLLVILPEPMLDSVLIDLDSTDHYSLSRRFNPVISEEGVYYEIFQQLKDVLSETKENVKIKAIESGIREETQKLAEDYITDFAETLGFKVKIVDSFDEEYRIVGPVSSVDTTIHLYIDSSEVIPNSILDTMKIDTTPEIDPQESLFLGDLNSN